MDGLRRTLMCGCNAVVDYQLPREAPARRFPGNPGAAILYFLSISIVLQLFLFPSSAFSGSGKTIVVGADPAYPPYEFLDKDGRPAGFNVDLTRAIAEVMGMNVEFRFGGWASLREDFDAGKIDLLQGISYSGEREKIMDFAPHSIVYHSIYARKGVPTVDSLRDLEGKEVVVMKNGIMHDTLVQEGYDITFIYARNPSDQLQMLASGKYDYAVVAMLPAAYLTKELGLSNIGPVAKSVAEVKYGYAVKKGNSELLARINEGLTILKETGRYQAIHQKWIGVIEPRGINASKIANYAAVILIPLLSILGGTIVWSQTLKKRVAQRTEELEREVVVRKRAVEELRLHQEQLVQADKMAALGILVSGVCHEINNPNGLILLNMPVFIDVFGDAGPIFESYYRENGDFVLGGLRYSRIRAEMPQMMIEMHDGAKRIKRIVDDLKNFARRDDSDLAELVDLNEVVKAAVRLVDNAIRKFTNRFETVYASDLPSVRGNSQRLEQVVVNLVLNACQALRDNTKGVCLSTFFDEKKVEVTLAVKDEGVGISADHMPHLTDPFFTTKRESGGSGLGLSVSAGIVKEHKGSIHFDSNPGKGTTVTLRLPANERTGVA